jgi:putative inorganic carbon (HCO3(-)) transporter
MSATATVPAQSPGLLQRAAEWSLVAAFRPLHALMASPSLLFMATLAAMLFRPPDLRLYFLDRVAFGLLILVVLLRALTQRQSLRMDESIKWPMLGLLTLAIADVLARPYQSEAWSILAAKWIVPFAMYYMAGLVFEDQVSLRRFETFALIVLGYLCITAILFLAGTKSLILPPFIVDESLGIHADRARGPFLQAVANGVTLNLLGLIALDSFRRRRLRGVLALLFLIVVPLAVLATKTRAVWLSFAASVLVLLFFSPSGRVRRACFWLALAGVLGVLSMLTFEDGNQSLSARLVERSPVEFRMAVYRAGWDMFQAKPLWGWGAAQMQSGLTMRISEFHQETFFFHNTYLEIAVQYGIVGLALYLWIVVDLFRLSRNRGQSLGAPAISSEGEFLDGQFRSLWPVLLTVYLLNACFVVMNYQFVNGLLFTLAGMLAAQNRMAHTHSSVLLS